MKSLVMLKKLHLEGGIVHGDIHGSNIAFKVPKDSPNILKDDLVLIDFGFARTLRPDDFIAFKTGALQIQYLSPWQMMDPTPPVGPRDDVYRLIEFVAHQLSQDGEELAIGFDTVYREALIPGPDDYAAYMARKNAGEILEDDDEESRSPFEIRMETYFDSKMNRNLFIPDERLGGQGCCTEIVDSTKRGQVQAILEAVVTSIRSCHEVDSVPDYEGILGLLQRARDAVLQ